MAPALALDASNKHQELEKFANDVVLTNRMRCATKSIQLSSSGTESEAHDIGVDRPWR